MKKKWIILLSFVAGILVTVLVPILVLATGVVNMGADVKPGLIERTLAPWARDRSVEKRTPTEKDPYAGNPSALTIIARTASCVTGLPASQAPSYPKESIRAHHRWERERMTQTENSSGSSNMASV